MEITKGFKLIPSTADVDGDANSIVYNMIVTNKVIVKQTTLYYDLNSDLTFRILLLEL